MKRPVKFTLDPLNKFEHVPTEALIQATGLLLPWAMLIDEAIPVDDGMIKQYQFYHGPVEGGEVQANGVYQFPSDPPLNPLVQGEYEDGSKIFFYHYGMLSVTHPNRPTWVARFD